MKGEGMQQAQSSNNRPHEDCRGCQLLTSGCDLKYAYSEKNKYTKECTTYQCPCGLCLVKSMCSNYCGNYLTYVGGYFEHIKENPSEYVDKYEEPVPPRTQYTITSCKGIPITVKYNMWSERVEVGPSIKDHKE